MVLHFSPLFHFSFSCPSFLLLGFSGTLPLTSLHTAASLFIDYVSLPPDKDLLGCSWECHCPNLPPFILHCHECPFCDHSFLWSKSSFTAPSHTLAGLCALQQLCCFSAWLKNKAYNLRDQEESNRATAIKKHTYTYFLWMDLLFLPLEKSSLQLFAIAYIMSKVRSRRNAPNLQLHTKKW